MGIKKITLETVAAYGSSEKVDVSANEMHSKRGKCLLTKSPYRIGQPRTLIPGAFATLFVAVASVLLFYGCQKDEKTTSDSIKQHKNWEVFTCTEVSPIGTIIVPDGQIPPCTRAFTKRFWNADKQRYTAFSHTTEIHNCDATDNLTTIEFVAELLPTVLNLPNIDYTDINNFILHVNDQVVTPAFLYENHVTIGSGFTFRITYENVVNVWNQINVQMEWGKRISKNDFNWVNDVFLEAFESFAKDTVTPCPYEQMRQSIQDAIQNRGYAWLYDGATIEGNENEIEYMKMIYDIFFYNPHENINSDIDNLLDEITSSDMQSEQKMRLCIYGKSFIGLHSVAHAFALKVEMGEIILPDEDEVIQYHKTNLSREAYDYQDANSRAERRFFSCMQYKLDQIGYGNIVDIAEFLVSAPISILWKAGSCLCEIGKGLWNHVR